MRAWLAVAACGLAACGPAKDNEDKVRECIYENPTIPTACVDEFIFAIQNALENDGEPLSDLEVQLLCGSFLAAVEGEVLHSSDSVPPMAPSLAFTKICAKVALQFRPAAAGSSADFAPAASDVDALYPCGDDGQREVLCASTTFPAGTTASLAMVMTDDLPRADPIRTHQFGFVFDADGDPDNNYEASAQYPNDFFDGTDRWYVAAYTPADGWSLDVSDATGGAVQPATSAARLVIDGAVMQLIVPAAELPAACPGYRMTSFSHTGDYGLSPPYDWSGDVEPAVAQPLEATCVELPPAG